MALIKCDECGHRISDHSLFCPNCGYPTYMNKQMTATTAKPEVIAVIEKQLTQKQTETEQPEQAAPTAETASKISEKLHESETETAADAMIEETKESTSDNNRSSNERLKVILFIGVFVALLAVVLYFYFTSPVEKTGIEAEEETIDMTEQQEITDTVTITPADTVKPVTPITHTTPTPVVKPVSKPVAKPTAKPSGETSPTHEVTVKSLREQATEPVPPATKPDAESE